MNRIGNLREVTEEDLEMMLLWRNAPSVRENMYTQHEISLAEHLSWWQRTKDREDQKYFVFENSGIPSGIVAFNAIDKENKNSSWAFYASPEAARGTGSKMEFLALEYAFNSLDLHKLCCEVLEFNKAVIKLHKKFGFQAEGVFRDQYLINQSYTNVHCLGILKDEWNENKEVMLERIISFSSR